MRSIYGFIVLSSLLFGGVATTASRAFEASSFEQFNSNVQANIFAEDNDELTLKDDSLLDDRSFYTPSKMLLVSHASKVEVHETRDKMPRGSGRIDSEHFEVVNESAETLDDARGSGRDSSKTLGRGSGRIDKNEEAHRASGRFEA